MLRNLKNGKPATDQIYNLMVEMYANLLFKLVIEKLYSSSKYIKLSSNLQEDIPLSKKIKEEQNQESCKYLYISTTSRCR